MPHDACLKLEQCFSLLFYAHAATMMRAMVKAKQISEVHNPHA